MPETRAVSIARDECAARDRSDAVGRRGSFVLPDAQIYLNGNSLGALPAAAADRITELVVGQWGQLLIGGWNAGWYDLPTRVGDRLAPLLGAHAGEVVVCDSTSVNLLKAVSAASFAAGGDRCIAYDKDIFPTDIYVAESAARAFNVVTQPVDVCAEEIPHDSVVVLTHVDYRSGRLYDMHRLTDLAHRRGSTVIWDVSHSVGVVPIDVHEWNIDYVVGCTYKYLNGGPGSPAFMYVAPQHLDSAVVSPAGWFGHAEPFAMSPTYTPATGIRRFLTGTPSVLAYPSLEASLDIFADSDIAEIRAKSIALTQLFIDLTSVLPEIACLSPLEARERGSQVSLTHQHAYPVVRRLADCGVVADFREPDVMRFGFAPLYNRFVDVYDAAHVLADVLADESWRRPEYEARHHVT